MSVFEHIFIPQAVLEEWSVGENLIVDGDTATLSPSEWRYRLIPALHVQTCAAGNDTRALVGHVRRCEDLRAGGADVSGGSVVWGDEVYDGVEGFIGERLDIDPALSRTAPALSPEARAAKEQEELEALSRAFLDA